jgi:hypothetical protein
MKTPNTIYSNMVSNQNRKFFILALFTFSLNIAINAQVGGTVTPPLQVPGDLEVGGDIKASHKLILGDASNQITFDLTPANSTTPARIRILPSGTTNGGGTNPNTSPDPAPDMTCINGTISQIYSFQDMVSVYKPNLGNINLGHNGINAFIETQGSGTGTALSHPGDLFINQRCQRNVLFFGHATPFAATQTRVVSIDGSLNVRSYMQLGNWSSSTFSDPLSRLFILSDPGSSSNGIRIKHGSAGNSGVKIATYNSADAFLVTNSPNSTNDGPEVFKIEADGKTTLTIDNPAKALAVKNLIAVENFVVYGNGKTYIGVQRPIPSGPHGNAMLAVDGKVLAKEIYVNIHNSVWADYVFDKNYDLMSLPKTEEYIKKHKHLPNVPSGEELTGEEYKLSLSDMQKIQMEKIEELFLHMIQQQKEIESLKAKNMDLEKQLKK